MYLVNAPSAATTASSGGSAGVSIVDTGTKQYFGSLGHSFNYTGLTVSSSANSIVALITADSSGTSVVPSTSASVLSAVWDSTATSQSMSLLTRGSSIVLGPWLAIFGLSTPTVGSGRTLTISWSSGSDTRLYVIAVSLINSNAVTPFSTTAADSNVATVTVNSSTNHLILCTAESGGSLTPTDNILYSDSVSGSFVNSFANWKLGASPNTSIGNGSIVSNIVAVDVSN